MGSTKSLRRTHRIKRLGSFWLFWSICGCQGTLGDAAPGQAVDGFLGDPDNELHYPVSPDPTQTCSKELGETPVRRLTNREYLQTVSDMFGIELSLPALIPDRYPDSFSNSAALQTSSPLLVDKYLDSAIEISEQVDLDAFIDCTSDAFDEQCLDNYAAKLISFAFRRPPLDGEVARLTEVYSSAKNDSDLRADVPLAQRMMLVAALTAPQFLYRVEIYTRSEDALRPLDGYEMASRLSYLLLGSLPDAELFAAAESGDLLTRSGLEAQTERLLATQKARTHLHDFFVQWFGVERLLGEERLDDAYTQHAQRALLEEVGHFTGHVLWNGDARLSSLLTDPTVFANQHSAQLYGASTTNGELVEIESKVPRPGIVGRAAFLAAFSLADQSDPIRRGQAIRERLLCAPAVEIPDDVNPLLPDLSSATTARERLSIHMQDPACSACHKLFDPIGFGLENFDHVGRYRETENEIPIDSVGEIIAGADASGTFNGINGLSQALANSDHVHDCAVQQWFSYVAGRQPNEQDRCVLEELEEKFKASNGGLVALVVQTIASDMFRFRTSSEKEAGK